MELTTVEELIGKLKEFPPHSKVFVGGTYGYLHTFQDEDNELVVSFDECEEIYY